jgi:hypothetical protein
MTQHRFPALSGLEDHPIRAYLTSILSGIADLPISRTAQVTPLLGRLAPNPRYCRTRYHRCQAYAYVLTTDHPKNVESLLAKAANAIWADLDP